jgi:hypothetical protein
MRNRNIIKLAVLVIVAAGVFLVVKAENPSKEKVDCQESMDGCCRKSGSEKGNKMIWESLPQQFFSSI